MMKQQPYEYETTLDALLDYIRELQKPTIHLLDYQRYQRMMEVAAKLQKLIAETMEEGSLDIEINKEFILGSIFIELPELTVLQPESSAQIILNADNFEIYSLTNGNIRLDITFHHIFKNYYKEVS